MNKLTDFISYKKYLHTLKYASINNSFNKKILYLKNNIELDIYFNNHFCLYKMPSNKILLEGYFSIEELEKLVYDEEYQIKLERELNEK